MKNSHTLFTGALKYLVINPKTSTFSIEDATCAVGRYCLVVGGIWIPSPREDSEVRGDPARTRVASWVWHNEDTTLFRIPRVQEGAGFHVF